MINKTAAETVLSCLLNQGVRVFCVCPGGRAAPFVEALSSPASWAGAAAKELEVLYFFEERSAGFFALGRAERDLRPPAVVTTSGTALAELLPSVIEGFYSGLPLVLLTADRPAGQRLAGAPQTLKTPLSLFRLYTADSIDLSARDLAGESLSALLRPLENRRSILHINMSFDEPLYSSSPALETARAENARGARGKAPPALPGPPPPAPPLSGETRRDPTCDPIKPQRKRSLNGAAFQRDRRAFARLCKKPLIVAAALKEPEQIFAAELLENYKGAFYAEPLSSLGFLKNRLRAGERTAAAFAKGFADGIIRIGGVPRARFWRDMERLRPPVFHLSSPPDFAGLSYKDRSFQHPLTRESLEGLLSSCGGEQAALKAADALKTFDEKQTKKQQALFNRFPESEPAWARRLHELLEEGAQIFLGNSLPVRLWDAAAAESDKKLSVKGQGGVNGIDGLLSRFFGGLQSENAGRTDCGPLAGGSASCNSAGDSSLGGGPAPRLGVSGGLRAAALIGDLSALYDMAGLWAAPKKNRSWKVFVMNNRGGRIFSRFSSNKRFLNEHSLSFRPLAEMFSLQYRLCQGRPQDCSWGKLKTAQLIEIRPNLQETEKFFQAYDKLNPI